MTQPPSGISLFDENGALSREFLLNRGFCCGNGCRNCPYDSRKVDAPPRLVENSPAPPTARK